jgi:hypothetical protein
VSFLFADLIIVPILLIYRRYYGARMAAVLAGTLYVAMVFAGYVVELVFDLAHLLPSGARHARTGEIALSWNYTTWLNIVFLGLAAALVWRFVRTGGPGMLSMMGGGPPGDAEPHDHHHAHQH